MKTLIDVRDALRSVIDVLLGIKYTGEPRASLEKVWDDLGKIAVSCSKAKQQLHILADMLDDGAQLPSEERSKHIAGEIRKYLEWLP